MIDIKGLHKADVLAALYNASRPQGMGFLQYNSNPMNRDEAQVLLNQTTYFDYLKGRVMKVDLSNDDSFDEWGYDRDNGNGAAFKVVQTLRQGLCVNNQEVRDTHNAGKSEAASQAKELLNTESKFTSPNTFNLGLADVKNVLEPRINKSLS